jgi:hypothetical protein
LLFYYIGIDFYFFFFAFLYFMVLLLSSFGKFFKGFQFIEVNIPVPMNHFIQVE